VRGVPGHAQCANPDPQVEATAIMVITHVKCGRRGWRFRGVNPRPARRARRKISRWFDEPIDSCRVDLTNSRVVRAWENQACSFGGRT